MHEQRESQMNIRNKTGGILIVCYRYLNNVTHKFDIVMSTKKFCLRITFRHS